MAKKPGGSKNNIANRGAAAKLKEINGKQVKPVKYIGDSGSYMAAAYMDNGTLVVDAHSKPIPYSQIDSN